MSSESKEDRSSSSEKGRSRSPYREEGHEAHSRSRSRDKTRKAKREHSESPSRRSKKTIIKIPELSGYLVHFSSFMNNQTERIGNDKLMKAYARYKKDWENKQNEIFLIEHKADAWFAEKYDPELRERADKERAEQVRAAAARFMRDYKAGAFDALCLSVSEPALAALSAGEAEDEEGGGGVELLLGQAVSVEGPPFLGFPTDQLTFFIKSIPRHISKYDILEEVRKLPGFVAITLSDPLKKQGFIRYCWLTFADEESFAKAAVALNGLYVKDTNLLVSKSNSGAKQKKIRVLKYYPKNLVETDLQLSTALIRTLDKEEGLEESALTPSDPERTLDLNLLYLRRVHAYDYFSAQHFADERSLSNKLGVAHLRVPVECEETYGISNVLKKIQQEVERRAEEPRPKPDYEKLVKDELLKIVGDDIEIVNGKEAWKCPDCTKKFIGSEYLLKHIICKHTELKTKVTDRAMEKSYLEDDAKITNYPQPPSRDDKYFDDRRAFARRRGGFRPRTRTPYQDLDDPNVKETDQKGRTLINFLDI